MAYKIDQIEGICDKCARKFEEPGVVTTEQLLERAATPKGRETLARESGIAVKLILKWANHADLFRIKGVAGQFAELLEASGVDTVKEFRHRVPENLHKRLEEINAERNLCGRIPTLHELEKMIAQAKELAPAVSY